jgi:hypothetical protein
MEDFNANDILFRASSNGHLMVEPRSKSEVLADGVKTHLVDLFITAKYGRREDIISKFLEKGNRCEEDSITLLSRVTGKLFTKNEERLFNDYVTAVPDLFIGESIENANETFDTKTSWSIFTFFRSKQKKNPLYYWQGVTAMWLTGAKKHTVAYCLVNSPADIIVSEKRRLSYQFGMLDEFGNATDLFQKKCAQIERNHIFDYELFCKHNPNFEFDTYPNERNFTIPIKERVHTVVYERNEADILRLQERIVDCRKWINENLIKTNKPMSEKKHEIGIVAHVDCGKTTLNPLITNGTIKVTNIKL